MRKWHIKSLSSSGTYIVILRDNRWSCSCPHWSYRLKGKASCKHIEEAKTFDSRMDRLMDSFEIPDFTIDMYPSKQDFLDEV